MARSKSVEPVESTRFAAMIVDWMWAQRPPLRVPGFASLVGVPKTTVWGWISHNRKPNPITLDRIAQVTGLPLAELYEACGYPLPQTQVIPHIRDAWENLVAIVATHPSFEPGIKLLLIERTLQVKDEGPQEQQTGAAGSSSGPPALWETRVRGILKDEQLSPEAKVKEIVDVLGVVPIGH